MNDLIRIQPRGVTNIESVCEAIESHNEFRAAEDAADAIKRWATSPVVDMLPHPTDEIVVRAPAEYRIKQIDIVDDDGLEVHYAPHATGSFPDYAAQLMQTIASNLGIPADVLSAQETNFASTGASESLKVFNERMEAFTEQMREYFRPAVLSLHKIMVQTSDAFFAAASLLYREQVGRLPGSERTSRLRKKRRNRVLDWYLNTYLPGDQE